MMLPGNASLTNSPGLGGSARVENGLYSGIPWLSRELKSPLNSAGVAVRTAETFVGEKEQCSVLSLVQLRNNYRAASRYTKLVLAERVASWQEEVAGVELLITQELPCRAVKCIGSSFRKHVDNAAGDAAKFRQIVVGLYLELLDVIDDGSIVVIPEKRQVVGAVQQKHVASVSLPVHCGKN